MKKVAVPPLISLKLVPVVYEELCKDPMLILSGDGRNVAQIEPKLTYKA